jgi:hypothetical protein
MKLIKRTPLAVIPCAIVTLLLMTSSSYAGYQGTKNTAPAAAPAAVDEFLFAGDAFDVTFLQPTVAHQQWSREQWKREFLQMRQLGIRSLVVQWSQYDQVSFVAGKNGHDSLLERITESAAAAGLELYIGLSLSKSWSEPHKLDIKLVNAELEENKALAKTIYARLERYPHFRGWYIPHELTDQFYSDYQQELILRFFAELSGYIRQLDPYKTVLASGYTSPENNNLVHFTMWWMGVFDKAGIDVLIFQDGAGTTAQDKWQDIYPYLEAISIIDNEYFGGDVWFLAEVFTQVDGAEINNKPFRAVPADFGRVEKQIEILGTFGKHMVSYSYFPYMRPEAGPDAARVYNAYSAYIEEKVNANMRQ